MFEFNKKSSVFSSQFSVLVQPATGNGQLAIGNEKENATKNIIAEIIQRYGSEK